MPGTPSAVKAAISLRKVRRARMANLLAAFYGGLFDLYAGGADDRPPLLDLGLVEGGEAFGRLLRARRDVEAELREARPHGRLGERLDHRGVERVDRVLRCAARGEEREPAGGVEAGDAAFV